MHYTTTWLTITGRDSNLLETESLNYLFRIGDSDIPSFRKFLHVLDVHKGFWPSKGVNEAYNELKGDEKVITYLELIGDYFPETFEYLTIKFNDETHGYKNP